jgi:hypothetical protein
MLKIMLAKNNHNRHHKSITITEPKKKLILKLVKKTATKTSVNLALATGYGILDKHLRPKTYNKLFDTGHEHGSAGAAIAADVDELPHALAPQTPHTGKTINTFIGTDAASAVILPIAYKGAKAGLEGNYEAKNERMEAKEQIIIDNNTKNKIQQTLTSIKNITTNNDTQFTPEQKLSLQSLLQTMDKICDKNNKHNISKLKLCKDMLSFSRAGFYASELLCFKFLTPLLVKLLTLCGIKGAVLPVLGFGISGLNTVVLTPIITILGTVMGTRAYRWADKELKHLKHKGQKYKAKFSAVHKAKINDEKMQAALNYIHNSNKGKLTFRTWACKIAKKFMTVFTAGMAAFTGLSIAAATLQILVWAGVLASAANPITGPAMIAVAAVILLGGSFFLFGHAKLHQYSCERDEIKEHELFKKYQFANELSKQIKSKIESGDLNLNLEQTAKMQASLDKLNQFAQIDQALRVHSLHELNIDLKLTKNNVNKHSDKPDFKLGLQHSIHRQAKIMPARILHKIQKKICKKTHERKKQAKQNEAFTKLTSEQIDAAIAKYKANQHKISEHNEQNFKQAILDLLGINDINDLYTSEQGLLADIKQQLKQYMHKNCPENIEITPKNILNIPERLTKARNEAFNMSLAL